MIIESISKLIAERKIAELFLLGLDGQVISGYGMAITLSFPAEKRKRMLDEIFGEKNDR